MSLYAGEQVLPCSLALAPAAVAQEEPQVLVFDRPVEQGSRQVVLRAAAQEESQAFVLDQPVQQAESSRRVVLRATLQKELPLGLDQPAPELWQNPLS